MRSWTTAAKLCLVLAYLFSFCLLNIVLVTANPTILNVNFSENSTEDSVIEQLLGANTTEQRTRLAKVANPHYYDLHYKIYLPTYDADVETKYKTEGVLLVEIEVPESTNFIEMHAFKLNISKVQLQGKGDETLKYTGFLEQNGLRGIYSDPFTSGGKEYASVVTQMQSNSARKMVPCFDEPEYKAVWRITVVHPKGSTAISNGQIISSQEILSEDEKSGPGWLITKYGETPKMSSYLIALIVGKMDFIEGKARNGTFPMRVYGRPEDVPACRYLLEIAIKPFDYFEQRFQIPCPLRKLDFFVPQGFDLGGMENWGLIIVNKQSALTARTRARIVVDCYQCDIELMGDVGILLNTETVYLVRWAILNGLIRYKTAHPDQYQTYYSGTVKQQLEDFRINVANNPLNGNLTTPAQAVELEEKKIYHSITNSLSLYLIIRDSIGPAIMKPSKQKNSRAI